MFGKKKNSKVQDPKIILGMIMLRDENSFDVDRLIKDYRKNYNYKIDKPTGDNLSFVFDIDGEMVAVAHMPAPIPSGDIENAAQYAYNWSTVIEDVKDHRSHLIVSILKGRQDQVKRYRIFTQLLCSLLRITNAIGVYKGNQSLLISKEDYIEHASLMREEYLPLNLWIYFGIRVSDKGNSGYTYGLNEFAKCELEIVNSSRSLKDVMGFIFDMAHYILDYDVVFKDKQTCGRSAEEKIAIRFSKGVFVEGKSFKLAY